MGDPVLLRHLGGRILIPPDQRGDLNFSNALERIEMLLTERALTGDTDLHRASLLEIRGLGLRSAACRVLSALARSRAGTVRLFSRMMWPTAVFEAGTV